MMVATAAPHRNDAFQGRIFDGLFEITCAILEKGNRKRRTTLVDAKPEDEDAYRVGKSLFGVEIFDIGAQLFCL